MCVRVSVRAPMMMQKNYVIAISNVLEKGFVLSFVRFVLVTECSCVCIYVNVYIMCTVAYPRVPCVY